MQTGNICVLQHGQGGATLHLQTGMTPEQTIETLARTIDESRATWQGDSKITAAEQVKREGRFASSIVAHFADEITGGNIRDVKAMGEFLVTGYPQSTGPALIVDPASQRVWVSPNDQSTQPSSPNDRALGFDDFVNTARVPGDLAKALGLTRT